MLMKTPKRKAPEKRQVREEPGVLMRAGSAMLAAAAARPGLTGGVMVFVTVFGMISANALWYQPGGHPSPLLRTRDAADPAGLIGFQRQDEQPANVTTFRIERSQPDETPVTGATPPNPAASALVREVQQELARLGHYQGGADGMAGPRTAAAILAFQKSVGLPENGDASDTLLALLKNIRTPQGEAAPVQASAPMQAAPVQAPGPPKTAAAPVPAARPGPAKPAPAAPAIDPVAEAIRKAEKTPSASLPVQPASVRPSSAPADPGLVMQIQRGLSKFAYSHIGVDGVAGSATREAIRSFEKAYRLPETGEPNERVLKKLKEIGAL